jgi:hypothetical protein
MVGLALALVTIDRGRLQRASLIGLAGAVGIAVGGSLSYGEYCDWGASPDAHIKLAGYASLFLVGILWGAFAGAVLGLTFSQRVYRWPDLLWRLILVWAAGKISYWIIIEKLGWSIGTRHQDWAAVLGMIVVLLLACSRDKAVLTLAGMGALGIGLGFVIGFGGHRVGMRLFAGSTVPLDWWKVAEQTIGFCGGAALGLGVLILERSGHPSSFEAPPAPWLNMASAIAVVWLVPAWNIYNCFTYWSWEKGLLPRGAVGLFIYLALIFTVFLVGLWLLGQYTGKRWWHTGDPRQAAALMFFCLVWVSTIIAGLKFQWPYMGAGYVVTQIGFTVAAILLTAPFIFRVAEKAKG